MDEREHLHHCLRLLASSDDPRHANHVMTALDSYLDSKLKRGWVGLTDEEINQAANNAGFGHINIAREIEAKLKEKNT